MSPTPVRRSHAERSAATQAQVLEAAARVVLTRSFQAATMFEVAKEAGVTPGALQHHFGSKAELMLKLLERQLHAQGDEALVWPDAALPLPRRAQGLLQTLWQGLYEQPRFLVAWGVYFGSVGDEALRARISELRATLQPTLHRHFLECLPELARFADAPAFIDMVLSCLRGMAMVRLFDTQAGSSAAQRQALAQVIEQRCASAGDPPSAGKSHDDESTGGGPSSGKSSSGPSPAGKAATRRAGAAHPATPTKLVTPATPVTPAKPVAPAQAVPRKTPSAKPAPGKPDGGNPTSTPPTRRRTAP